MQSSAETIWPSAQQLLRSMLNPDIYNLWFHPIRALTLEEETITLEVANDFCEVWLKDNYLGLIRDVLTQCSGQTLKVKFVVNANAVAPVVQANNEDNVVAEPKPRARVVESSDRSSGALREPAFNPKNTFDTFVVGENNNHAHAAAFAVSQSPGRSYNPLYLHGGVGLGKTHLLQAIGQHVAGSKKGVRVSYMSAEKFTNEYID